MNTPRCSAFRFNTASWKEWKRGAAAALLLLVFASPLLGQKPKTSDEQTPPKSAPTTEWDRLREGLSKAIPMPDSKTAAHPSSATLPGNTVHFDPKTQTSTEDAPGKVDTLAPRTNAVKGQSGKAPEMLQGEPVATPATKSPEGAGLATSAGTLAITPTAPGPLTTPYAFPFDSEYRLLLRFNTGGVDYYYLCSASQASNFHLLSAGHCIYNHDIKNDGSDIGGFAAEIWAWPAETDVVDPIDHTNWPDYPYGVSKGTYWLAYDAWISNSDFNWDFSFITLDRRTGDHIGWMGREWGVTASSLNYDGYPAEAPYVPSDNPFQYPGFDSGNVRAYTDNRIQMDAYTYGGHSGGGVWRYDSAANARYIEGVNSTSNRVGYAEATRYTSTNETTLQNQITADNSSRVPASLPQVIEYVFNNSSKGLLNSSVAIGDSFGLQLNAFNAGYASAGTVYADVYLTTNYTSVTSGHFLGTLNLGSLDANTYTVQNQNVTVPRSIAPGTWYVGYRLRSDVAQYGTDNPDVVITKQFLTTTCPTDAYESDNSSSAAKTIASGQSQSHSICGPTDQDWVKFTLTASSAVSLQTSPGTVGGDTTLTLYDSNLNQIDFNDDANALYSTITRACASNPLPAGTYYAKVASFNGTTVIPQYNLSFTSTSCGPAPALSGLSVSPTTITASGHVTGTVTLSAAAPTGGVTVSLTSNYSYVTPPASVVIPAGATSATFTINASQYAAPRSAVITATYSGVSKTATITVTSSSTAALSALSVSPTSVGPSGSVTGTVTLTSAAPAGGISVALSSDYSYVTPPASVVVPAGATSANFTIAVSQYATPRSAIITAAYSGVSKTATITVTSTAVAALSSVTTSPTSIGPSGSVTGTVTLTSVAPSGGLTVALTSNYSYVTPPSSVVVPAGATSVNFTITASQYAAPRSAIITATYNGVSKSATITVTTATTAALSSVTVSPTAISASGSITGTVTLTAAAPSGGATVALSRNYSYLTVPASVVVPAGATSVHFTITASQYAAPRSAIVQATYNGVTKTATITVQ
jgi:hypothetical protein